MQTFSTKNLIICGIYTALILACQIVLSGIAGVELVSVLLLAFCYVKGVKSGLLVATSFSLIRCFVFGFMPQVIVLYLIYYNLFAIVFGFIGSCFSRTYSVKAHVVSTFCVGGTTVLFTLFDCIITPLMYSFTHKAANAYFIASIPVVIPHVICVVATTVFLFFPLVKALLTTQNQDKKQTIAK